MVGGKRGKFSRAFSSPHCDTCRPTQRFDSSSIPLPSTSTFPTHSYPTQCCRRSLRSVQILRRKLLPSLLSPLCFSYNLHLRLNLKGNGAVVTNNSLQFVLKR